jgi:hypothetical protein
MRPRRRNRGLLPRRGTAKRRRARGGGSGAAGLLPQRGAAERSRSRGRGAAERMRARRSGDGSPGVELAGARAPPPPRPWSSLAPRSPSPSCLLSLSWMQGPASIWMQGSSSGLDLCRRRGRPVEERGAGAATATTHTRGPLRPGGSQRPLWFARGDGLVCWKLTSPIFSLFSSRSPICRCGSAQLLETVLLPHPHAPSG